MRTFFTECVIYKRQRIPLKGHHTAQSLEEKTNEEKELLLLMSVFTLKKNSTKSIRKEKDARGNCSVFVVKKTLL